MDLLHHSVFDLSEKIAASMELVKNVIEEFFFAFAPECRINCWC